MSEKKKAKKAGWPRARLARQHEGKVGQSWRARTENLEGVDAFGNKKMFRVEVGPFLCRCGAVVRIDKNGFAACEKCGEIYNDGKTIRGTEYHMSKAKKKKELERFKASLVDPTNKHK